MAASDLGGNVEISRAGQTFVTDVSTQHHLVAAAPGCHGASVMDQLLSDGDEIASVVVITHGGSVVQTATVALLA